jgi:hypothetical protein
VYHDGWSVVVIGVAEQVRNRAELDRLEHLPLRPWEPGPKPHWVRVRAGAVTGRAIDRTVPA